VSVLIRWQSCLPFNEHLDRCAASRAASCAPSCAPSCADLLLSRISYVQTFEARRSRRNPECTRPPCPRCRIAIMGLPASGVLDQIGDARKTPPKKVLIRRPREREWAPVGSDALLLGSPARFLLLEPAATRRVLRPTSRIPL